MKSIEKLQISVGILAWKSGQTLVNTLETYHKNGLFNIINDACILFQEFSEQDEKIANHFGLSYIVEPSNIGIGAAFMKLTQNVKTDNVLVLEHDWKLIEDIETTYNRLKSGIELLNSDIDCVRYRHRQQPGHPHFSFKYRDRELDYYDKEIDAQSPHLLDSLHWLNPDEKFGDKIWKSGEYFVTYSKWANFTNNPCLYKKQFYIDNVGTFIGAGIELEGKISKWWNRQDFKVAHGEGLFTHKDEGKYGE